MCTVERCLLELFHVAVRMRHLHLACPFAQSERYQPLNPDTKFVLRRMASLRSDDRSGGSSCGNNPTDGAWQLSGLARQVGYKLRIQGQGRRIA